MLVDDFASWAGGAIGDVALARMTPLETGCFWGGKALYAVYFVAAPLAASPHGWPALAALWLASEFVAGYMLALMFQARLLVLAGLGWLCACACEDEHLKGLACIGLRDEDSLEIRRHGNLGS